MNVAKLIRDGLWTLGRNEDGKILPCQGNSEDNNFGQYDSEEDHLHGIGR